MADSDTPVLRLIQGGLLPAQYESAQKNNRADFKLQAIRVYLVMKVLLRSAADIGKLRLGGLREAGSLPRQGPGGGVLYRGPRCRAPPTDRRDSPSLTLCLRAAAAAHCNAAAARRRAAAALCRAAACCRCQCTLTTFRRGLPHRRWCQWSLRPTSESESRPADDSSILGRATGWAPQLAWASLPSLAWRRNLKAASGSVTVGLGGWP